MSNLQKKSVGPAKIGEDEIHRATIRTRVEHAGLKDGKWILKLRAITETFIFAPDNHPFFYANDPVTLTIEKETP